MKCAALSSATCRKKAPPKQSACCSRTRVASRLSPTIPALRLNGVAVLVRENHGDGHSPNFSSYLGQQQFAIPTDGVDRCCSTRR